MPVISVIVPVYRVEEYLGRCVGSVLAQSFWDFELVLVDDGSPDNCGKMCDEFAKLDSRIHVIHKANGGLSDARNVGIDYAFSTDSEWLTFIDSDDWVHPMYLEALYRAVSDNDLLISSCGLERVSEYGIADSVDISSTVETSSDVYTCFKTRGVSYAVARLYRKALFRNIRYPKGRLFEDVFTSYKIFLSVENIAYIKEPLYYYYINESGIVRNRWTAKSMDEFDGYEEQLQYLSGRKDLADVYRVIQFDYMTDLSRSYFKLRDNEVGGIDKKKYLDILSAKMRSALKKYKKNTGVTVKNNTPFFEAAYPVLINFYWKRQRLLSVFKKGENNADSKS